MTRKEMMAALLAHGWQEVRKEEGSTFEKEGSDAIIAVMDNGNIVITQERKDGFNRAFGRCNVSECFLRDGRIYAGASVEL